MINKYLSDEDISKVQKSFYHEFENSLVYSNISIWLNSKGLIKLSKYYADWAQEEYNHGMWVKDFMESLNIPMVPSEIKTEHYNFDKSLIEFANVTLVRENLTTGIYKDMMISALDMNELGSAMWMSFILKMSSEQIEEEDKVTTLIAKLSNISDFNGLMLFDNTFD